MNDGTLDRLPRTREAIEDGIRARLHLGAQLHVSLQGEPVADAALGENRPGEPLTRGHLMHRLIDLHELRSQMVMDGHQIAVVVPTG